MKDISGVIEIWRTQWLEHLEYHLSRYKPRHEQMLKVHLAWMRTFGSMEDILTMIGEGDLDESLRQRFEAIIGDIASILALRELWEDKRLDGLVEGFITGPHSDAPESERSDSDQLDSDGRKAFVHKLMTLYGLTS
jgi:hypothetical protein